MIPCWWYFRSYSTLSDRFFGASINAPIYKSVQLQRCVQFRRAQDDQRTISSTLQRWSWGSHLAYSRYRSLCCSIAISTSAVIALFRIYRGVPLRSRACHKGEEHGRMINRVQQIVRDWNLLLSVLISRSDLSKDHRAFQAQTNDKYLLHANDKQTRFIQYLHHGIRTICRIIHESRRCFQSVNRQ